MWATYNDAEVFWPDAPLHSPPLLDALLQGAHEQCEQYAPALEDGAVVPARYVQAVVMQARELWAATRREGDLVGFDTYAVRVRPLAASVKALLRPPRAVPSIR